MGYRSDLAIVMDRKVEDAFIKACTMENEWDSFHACGKRLETGSDVLYSWHSIKANGWQKVMSLFWEILNEDPSLENGLEQYLWIRIGEDTTDIEIEGNYGDNAFKLGLERGIAHSHQTQE